MNINKETLKLLAEMQDICSNTEKAYEEMLEDMEKEYSILGKQKAELLIKTFEEKPLSEIEAEIVEEKIRCDELILKIKINNNIFHIQDHFTYKNTADVIYIFDIVEEKISIGISKFIDNKFLEFLYEVKEYFLSKSNIEYWEEDTRKKKRYMFMMKNYEL